jgi:hypothetical protein
METRRRSFAIANSRVHQPMAIRASNNHVIRGRNWTTRVNFGWLSSLLPPIDGLLPSPTGGLWERVLGDSHVRFCESRWMPPGHSTQRPRE